MVEVSVIIPVYNEEECVEPLCSRLDESLSRLKRPYEIILVDDGSTDRTWDLLKACAEKYPHFRLIQFRRNFGQTAAMSAGFHHARGDAVVTLDADLQNNPDDIPILLEKLNDNYDVVSGWRRDRKDPFINRRLPSIIANWLISWITGVKLHDYGCTLKAYRRDILQDVHLYGEMHRFIPALVSWVGGRVGEVEVRHQSRQFGQSKYGISRIFRVILDLITVKFLLRYSMGPMQMFGKIGAVFMVPGLVILAVMLTGHFSFLLLGTAFASDLVKRPIWVMSTAMLIFLGMQFISMGLLAEIQIRTYHEAQSKRTYVVREMMDSSTDS